MANIGLRFNLDAEEVELTVDGVVALSSGQEVFLSWVNAYNEKHKAVEPEPEVDKPGEDAVESSSNDEGDTESVEASS